MTDIFISYAGEDRDRITPIVRAIEEQGWSLFWDWKSLPVGKTWRQFIKEGLDEARCVLVLWSEKSINSEWVIEEADHGKAKRILIPALLDDVRPPIGFGQIHAARLIGWKGEPSHEGFQQLIKACSDLLGPHKILLPTPEPSKKITNSIGMEFVLITPGSFTMGSTQIYDPWYEAPPHEVKISQPYYLQTTQVTLGQFKKVIGRNPINEHTPPNLWDKYSDDRPVIYVSWEDAHYFIKHLNQIEETKVYRLASEAEWEYACRAGSKLRFFFGEDENMLGEFAWYHENSNYDTHPVGEKKPNAWGLYDMYGNVWEFVEDDWHKSYNGAPADGRAWVDDPRSDSRVLRGGCRMDIANFCTSAARKAMTFSLKYDNIGFRLARPVFLGS